MSPPWGPANTEKIAKITMSQCQQSLHLCKLNSTARWKIVSELFLKVRCGDCGERWKMKISLHGVGMIHISRAHNQRQNTETLKYQQKIETTNIMPAWKCDGRRIISEIGMGQRPTREEGNTVVSWFTLKPCLSLNCCPWHDRTLPTVLRSWDPAWTTVTAPLHFTHFTIYSQAGDVKCNRPS